jgi:hypothetical protein
MGTRSFNSQSTFNIRVKGTKRTSWIYAGDQWATAAELWDSRWVYFMRVMCGSTNFNPARYIWLPVEVDDRTGSLEIIWHDIYSIDVKTGDVYSIPCINAL